MISVVGGFYVERCIQPRWDNIFGSGGRAALALATKTGVRFSTYVDDVTRPEIETRAVALGSISLQLAPTPKAVSFDYVHPLSVPSIAPPLELVTKAGPILVQDDVVLRFGMLEGDAIVTGKRVVYDPQSAHSPAFFRANGSSAETLAVVANGYEVRLLTGEPDPVAGARAILACDRADVVVVKRGAQGAVVVTGADVVHVPAYLTELVFSIGSGDMFAAAFAYFWGEQALDPTSAADLASKTTARYCETRAAALLSAEELAALELEPVVPCDGRVYLAGPFFSLGQRWLVEEARAHLRGLGLRVFSPVHDVGAGPASVVAPADLAELSKCDRVLALVDGADPGTLFEIGYARALNLPVIALAEALSAEDQKMIVGSQCIVTDDFVTALYRVAWTAP
jgi:nucleoside 2-deoxyribosyltransferase